MLIITKILEKLLDFNVVNFINDLFSNSKYNTYLEIGVRNGGTFKKIKGPELKLAVDIKKYAEFNKLCKNEMFFEMTSDQFFDEYAAKILGKRKVDVAFIDGYHEFYQVMKDFNNIEEYISENGIIFIHDCNPVSWKYEGEQYGGNWNGDVWKAIYYLRKYRKGLNIVTLNCDQGIGTVWGFGNKTKKENEVNSDEMKKIKILKYDFLDLNRKNILNLKSPFYWRKIKVKNGEL